MVEGDSVKNVYFTHRVFVFKFITAKKYFVFVKTVTLYK